MPMFPRWRTFSDAGFSYYTPVQRKVITERSKLAHTRPAFACCRFLRLQDPWQREALDQVLGVIGVVKNQGRPLTVTASDIELL